MKIFLATENAGKVHEVREILKQSFADVECLCVADLPASIREKYHAEETGTTYAENALIKARALARLTDGFVLAEDSGFEVEALSRAPGIFSARYAPTDRERCEKILHAIKNVPAHQRQAQFVACVAFIEKRKGMQSPPVYFFGRRVGRVADAIRGTNGFGYDPIFYPEGENLTWGEAGEKAKVLVSHRGLAMRLAIQYLIARMSQEHKEADSIKSSSYSSDG